MKQQYLILVLILSIIVSQHSIYGQGNNSGLVESIAENSPEEIQRELSRNTNINAKINDLGWTALHAAVSFRRDDIVSVLIELKANIDVQDNSGKTPLLIAVETGQYNTASYLILKGAKVNIASNSGDNPLSISQKIGLDKISNLLLDNNASLPGGNNQNPAMRGSRRGAIPGGDNMMPGNMNMRRGPGANNENQMRPNPAVINSTNDTAINTVNPVQSSTKINASGRLDPNEVKARIEKYEGLAKAVDEVAGGSKSEIRNWEKVDTDNRTSIISAVRRQYEDEVELIQKIAMEEKAQKTIELAENLLDSRKDAFLAVNRIVRDQGTQSSSSRTNSSSRRTTNRNTSRTNRRGSTTTQSSAATEDPLSRYSAEIRSEIELWLDSNVTNKNGRIKLMESVDEMLVSEINSLKQTAANEKAEKTMTAADGLLLARQIRYEGLKNVLENTEQEEEIYIDPGMYEYEDQNMMNGRGMNRGQTMDTGRGMRGR